MGLEGECSLAFSDFSNNLVFSCSFLPLPSFSLHMCMQTLTAPCLVVSLQQELKAHVHKPGSGKTDQFTVSICGICLQTKSKTHPKNEKSQPYSFNGNVVVSSC